ncbi:hypothetical protein DU475_23850, partial [Rhodopseudomonas sp. WA056]|uniref:DUF5343 domain-containing protein n=1 Tax=Rhodopseudomonas sp. WA056 TaxID=2269367 RepID=UPI00196856D2
YSLLLRLVMGDFAYTTVPGKIKALLEKIRIVGIPSKVTVQWLKSVGFTSSNDKTLIGVLKQAGLIDTSGGPTATWTAYRGAKHKQVLGNAIRKGYADLYAVYSDAHLRSTTELDHVFSTSSSAGKQVIGKTVATFKALTDEAEFAIEGEPTELVLETPHLHEAPAQHPNARTATASNGGPSLHIDVQIHISPEATSDQIDQIFASMAKHLYGAKNTE